MNKCRSFLFLIGMVVALATSAQATNGDNLIGIGPISRAMGGVGIAAPQDSISAVFSNPAGMCFAPYCNASTFDFAGTLFIPKVDAKITTGAGTIEANSNDKIFAIPAIGISTPLNEISPAWRFGIAAYGVSGLGVDYRGSAIDVPDYYMTGAPLVAGDYTQLQIMKFAPTVAVQALDKLSIGLSLHIDYASLDLRDGSSPNYGYGFEAGVLCTPVDKISIGLTYVSPQTVNHKNISDFDGNGTRDDLELEAPQQVGLGIAFEPLDKEKLLIEADTKWINWSDAKGYKDFDWEDQWVYAVGAQFKPVDKVSLRAGFNYGKSPLKEHDGFNGAFSMSNVQTVQDATLPNYYYETFRIIGFPAVVEKHITLGAGYQLTKVLTLNAGYMHAFKNTVSESGTDLFGNPVTLESSLSESSYDFGMTWVF
jgi:long-chain fatty acid transport protein